MVLVCLHLFIWLRVLHVVPDHTVYTRAQLLLVLLNSLTLMAAVTIIFIDQEQCSAEAEYMAAFYAVAISSLTVTMGRMLFRWAVHRGRRGRAYKAHKVQRADIGGVGDLGHHLSGLTEHSDVRRRVGGGAIGSVLGSVFASFAPRDTPACLRTGTSSLPQHARPLRVIFAQRGQVRTLSTVPPPMAPDTVSGRGTISGREGSSSEELMQARLLKINHGRGVARGFLTPNLLHSQAMDLTRPRRALAPPTPIERRASTPSPRSRRSLGPCRAAPRARAMCPPRRP